MPSSQRPSSAALQLFPSGIVQQLVGARVRPAHVTEATAKIAVVAFAWRPLVLLSALEGSLFGGEIPFARDFAAQVRFLAELPVLLASAGLAQVLVHRALAYLFDAGLVREEKRASFNALLVSTSRANRSRIVGAAVMLVAVVASWSEMRSWVEVSALESSWRVREGAVTNAGLWFVLVARPILYAQFAFWLFRFALWTRLLFRIARMVNPVAAHPDGMGGLGPLNPAHTGFAAVAFVIGADLAAGLANRLVHVGGDLASYRGLVAAIILTTAAVLLAPMLFFIPGLYRAQVRATFEFGIAAVVEAREIDARIGRAAAREPFTNVASAFTYYLHISESMRRMRRLAPVPLYRRTVVVFMLAVSLPFAIAALTELPIGELLRRVHGLMELSPVKAK